MSNAKLLFKSIDEPADKARREREVKERFESARRDAIGARTSKCEFRKHVNAMYHPGYCEHPDRYKEGETYFRHCLKTNCPLFQ
jgi:hypothetical protein